MNEAFSLSVEESLQTVSENVAETATLFIVRWEKETLHEQRIPVRLGWVKTLNAWASWVSWMQQVNK